MTDKQTTVDKINREHQDAINRHNPSGNATKLPARPSEPVNPAKPRR